MIIKVWLMHDYFEFFLKVCAFLGQFSVSLASYTELHLPEPLKA